jgi:hypothetical protein
MPDVSQPHRTILDASVRVPEHVVHRAFPTETVLLNLRTGKYHGLNPTGGRMFELLEATGAVAEVAAQVADEYGQPLHNVREDLCRLCADLAKRGLIEIGVRRMG